MNTFFNSLPRHKSSQMDGFNNIVFDGNSITWGTQASNPDLTSYPAKLMETLGADFVSTDNYLGSSVVGYNAAVPSQNTQQMINDAATEIDPLYDADRYDRNILIAWEITNDLTVNRDVQAAFDRFVTYCQARISVGWHVVAVTMLPRTQVHLDDLPGLEQKRQQVNQLMRRYKRTYCHRLIDLGADSLIGIPGASDNTTYYSDKVHPNDAGYVYIAQKVYKELLTIPA